MHIKTVLEKIRKTRQIKEIKQFDIAKQLSISTSAYGKLERGETELTLVKLKKIAEILEVPTLSLLDGTLNYVIKTGDDVPSALSKNHLVQDNEVLTEQLIVSQEKETASKDEIISAQKELIFHLKNELGKRKK